MGQLKDPLVLQHCPVKEIRPFDTECITGVAVFDPPEGGWDFADATDPFTCAKMPTDRSLVVFVQWSAFGWTPVSDNVYTQKGALRWITSQPYPCIPETKTPLVADVSAALKTGNRDLSWHLHPFPGNRYINGLKLKLKARAIGTLALDPESAYTRLTFTSCNVNRVDLSHWSCSDVHPLRKVAIKDKSKIFQPLVFPAHLDQLQAVHLKHSLIHDVQMHGQQNLEVLKIVDSLVDCRVKLEGCRIGTLLLQRTDPSRPTPRIVIHVTQPTHITLFQILRLENCPVIILAPGATLTVGTFVCPEFPKLMESVAERASVEEPAGRQLNFDVIRRLEFS